MPDYPKPIYADNGGNGVFSPTAVVPAITAANVNTSVIPALGVGIRIRISGGVIGITRAAAGTIVDIILTDGIGGAQLYRGTFAHGGDISQPIIIPSPGISCSDNTPLIASVGGTVAAGAAFILVYFTFDNLT